MQEIINSIDKWFIQKFHNATQVVTKRQVVYTVISQQGQTPTGWHKFDNS